MSYSEMTDFEINLRVSLLQGYDANVKQHFGEAGLATVKTTEGMLDFCNSWADAGPIIEKNLIALKPASLFVGGYRWFASKGEGDFGKKTADDNPLRAAMILFLMLKEGKDDKITETP